MSEKRKYDSTVARIAGNLLSGVPQLLLKTTGREEVHSGVERAVYIARAIVAQVELTEPKTLPDLTRVCQCGKCYDCTMRKYGTPPMIAEPEKS